MVAKCKLAIYGAGGLGREVYDLAIRINAKKNKWNDIYFIDDVSEVDNILGVKVYKFEDSIKISTKSFSLPLKNILNSGSFIISQ